MHGVLSIDIETYGPHGPILAIGAVFGSCRHVKSPATFCVALEVDPHQCSDERSNLFWKRNAALHTAMESTCVPFAEGMHQFLAFLDRCWKKSPSLKIVTDNPSFDIGLVDRLMQCMHRDTLQYNQLSGKYKFCVVDVLSLLQGALRRKNKTDIKSLFIDVCVELELAELSEFKTGKAHHPVNDAMLNYVLYCKYIAYCDGLLGE
jgi:hypothetical protein